MECRTENYFLLLDDAFGRLYFLHFFDDNQIGKFIFQTQLKFVCDQKCKTKCKFFFKVLEPSATVIRDKTLIYRVPKADNSCRICLSCLFSMLYAYDIEYGDVGFRHWSPSIDFDFDFSWKVQRARRCRPRHV